MFHNQRKVLGQLSKTIVGGGNMAGEMCPRTAIVCQAARKINAVAIGKASGENIER